MQEKQYRLKRLYQSYGQIYVPGIYNESELPVFLRGRGDYTELINVESPTSVDVESPTELLPELRNKLRKVKQVSKDVIVNESDS